MKDNQTELIISNELANPIVNDQLEVIKFKMDFVTHVFGYDLVHTDFHFRVGPQNWVELVARHRNRGETVLGWGRSELEATNMAFNDAWDVASHDPHVRYGNWENEYDCREQLSKYSMTKYMTLECEELYKNKLKALGVEVTK
jgi:hypothetical protein